MQEFNYSLNINVIFLLLQPVKLSPGVMAALQILVLPVQVRILGGQHKKRALVCSFLYKKRYCFYSGVSIS